MNLLNAVGKTQSYHYPARIHSMLHDSVEKYNCQYECPVQTKKYTEQLVNQNIYFSDHHITHYNLYSIITTDSFYPFSKNNRLDGQICKPLSPLSANIILLTYEDKIEMDF